MWKLPDGRDWLSRKLGLVLMVWDILIKSLNQCFVNGWNSVPSLLFTWDQTMVEVMKIMMTSFKRSHANTAKLSAPNPAAGHCQPMPLPETPGHTWANLGQLLVGSLLFPPGSWDVQSSVCALQESISPVLCKLWQLLLQESLCHTQICCTQPKSDAPRAPAPATVHC